MTRRIVWIILFLVVTPTALFLLRGFGLEGGDSGFLDPYVKLNWQYYVRAPLLMAVYQSAWKLVGGYGWSVSDIIALSSSIAGGVFIAGVIALSKDPRVWLIMLVSKTSFIYLGHVENYAWPYALSVWCFALARRCEESGGKSWPVWAVATLGVFCHPMTLMIWPGLLWAFPPTCRKSQMEPLIATIVVVGVTVFFQAFGNYSGFFQPSWILPLFEIGDSAADYTLFSWAHWSQLLWFYLFSLPIGAALLLWKGWRVWAGWRGGLMMTVLVTLAWSVVWNPTLGTADWDLFGWPSVFVNMAGGLALAVGSGDGIADDAERTE